MIERKMKKCKGTGQFKGLGCGEIKYIHRYGVCANCFGYILYNTDVGRIVLDKAKKIGKNRANKEVKKEERQKKQSLKKFNFYKTTAWKWCSRYVLLYYADNNLMVNCSTSPHLSYHVTDRNIHAGHFIPYREGNSTNNSTALLFENLAPQCASDNTKFGGKPEIMKQWLIDKHGKDKIEELSVIKRQPLKLDKSTIKEFSDKYRGLFNNLLKERSIQNPWLY